MAVNPVAAAIAATEEAPARATVQVTLGDGTVFIVNAPAQLAPIHLLAFANYVTGPDFAARLSEAAGARPSPILVPSHQLARG